MQEPGMTKELIASHGLTDEEYRRICDILGRDPNFTELGIFSVMWSEHCSYKNSKPVLKLFPREGKNLLVKAGEENAGVVDIGDGLASKLKPIIILPPWNLFKAPLRASAVLFAIFLRWVHARFFR